MPSTDLPNASPAKRVAIILVIWNGKEDTVECLASLREDRYPNKEVVIVDNGSTDDSVAVIRADFPEATILQTGANLGFTGGNNAGIRYALGEGKADYAFLLNNDTTLEPDALSQLVAAAEEDPRRGLLVPVIHYYDPPRAIWFSGSSLDLRKGTAWHDNSREPGLLEAPYEIPWANGCAMLVPAKLLAEMEGLDDRFFLSWEDVDLSLRIIETGRTVVLVPGSRIYHKCAKSGMKLTGIHCYYAVRNSLLLERKHGGWRYVPAALSIVSTYLWSCLRPRFDAGKRSAALLTIWDAVRDHLLQNYGRYRRQV